MPILKNLRKMIFRNFIRQNIRKNSAGFTLIEVVISISLMLIVMLIFLQGFSLAKNINQKNFQQELFEFFGNNNRKASSTFFADRGLKIFIPSDSIGAIILGKEDETVGKRYCLLKNITTTRSVETAQFENFETLSQGTIRGSVTGLKILGTILVATMNSATSSDPDLLLIDIQDRNKWKLISSLNTGPGVASMAVQGHFVFLANTSINSQFQVVDVGKPENPILVTSLKIPGSISSDSKRNPVITSISSNTNGHIYLGSQKSDLGEIFVADFDGSKLSYLNSYDTGAIVNDLFADSTGVWATSPSDEELFHLDNDGNIDFTYNADGLSGNGKRIDIIGDLVKLLGRTFGSHEFVQIGGPGIRLGGSIDDMLFGVDEIGEGFVTILLRISGSSQIQIWNMNTIENASGTQSIKLDQKVFSAVLPSVSNRLGCAENDILIGTASTSAPFIILKAFP